MGSIGGGVGGGSSLLAREVPQITVNVEGIESSRIIPRHLQRNSGGNPSVLTFDVWADFDEVQSLVRWESQVSLVVREPNGEDEVVFLGKIPMRQPELNRQNNKIRVVAMDAFWEMGDKNVYWKNVQATPAFFIRTLFEGRERFVAPFGQIPVYGPLIDPSVCILQEDLGILDESKPDMSFAGARIGQAIGTAVGKARNAVCWIEPLPDGSTSRLRVVRRGDGPQKRVTTGYGVQADLIEMRGTEDALGVVNRFRGRGARKRHQLTDVDPENSQSLTLERGWPGEMKMPNHSETIDAEVLEKPGLVGKSDAHQFVGRRWVLPDPTEGWTKKRHLLQKLEGRWVNLGPDYEDKGIVDDDLELWVRHTDMLDEDGKATTNEWQPYTGRIELKWEMPAEIDPKTGQRVGYARIRPNFRELPERLVVLTTGAMIYDIYQRARDPFEDDEFPDPGEPGGREFSDLKITFAYEEDDVREEAGYGFLEVTASQAGTFPRRRESLMIDNNQIYEDRYDVEPVLDNDGNIITLNPTKITVIRNDGPKFLEMVTQHRNALMEPEARMSFVFGTTDFSCYPGHVITEIDNTELKNLLWVARSVGFNFSNWRMTLRTSSRLLEVPN